MGNVYGVVDESCYPSWAGFPNDFGNLQEHQIENVFNITPRIMKKRTFRRNSECERPGIFITIMEEIDIGQRSSDRMGEGKRLCLRWLRSVCWSDGTWSRSSRKKMERPSWRSQDVFITSRCSGNRWRNNWIRVENFRGFSPLSNSSRDPERLGREEHPTRELLRPDHLHVNVQWHSVENWWWELHL